MLYDDVTYESILGRMLSRVEAWAGKSGINIDTREGSLIRTALSPAAVELKLMYAELDEILNESFADTASREFLIRRCAERGISPEPATKAIWRGFFDIDASGNPNTDVLIGSRFSLKQKQLIYMITERISQSIFQLECETPGVAGNDEGGALIPFDGFSWLKKAELTDIIVHGEDEETTEHLRRRYFDSLNMLAFGGNVADYKEKVNKLQDVGGCKVYPVWKGGGTVKVVILNSKFQKPSQDLVDYVQTRLDPTQNKGEGLGIAPIGHVVTVAGADETAISIKMRISFQTGYSWEKVKTGVEAAIDEYFNELSAGWDKVDWENDPNATLIVRIYYIVTRVLAVPGIIDVQDIKLNNSATNIALAPNNIPKRGEVANAS